MLNDKTKKILKWIGYPTFAIISFMMFLLWTFPFEQIKGQIQSELDEKYGIQAKIETLSASLPFGIKATNVTLKSDKKEYAALLPLSFDSLVLNVSPISTMLGNPDVSFEAELFGGEVAGDVQIDQDEKVYYIDLELDELDFAKMSYFKSGKYKDFPIKGILSMDTELKLDFTKIKNSVGNVNIHVSDGVLGPGKMTFELPMVKSGTFDANFIIKDGKLTVKQFEQSSPDMMSNMIGHITLAQNLLYSRLNLDYRFKIADHLIKKHDVFKLALSAIKNAEGTDKYFYFNMRGAISSSKPVPSKSSQYKFKKKSSSKSKSSKVKGKKSKKKKKKSKLSKPKRTTKKIKKATKAKKVSKARSKSKASKKKKGRKGKKSKSRRSKKSKRKMPKVSPGGKPLIEDDDIEEDEDEEDEEEIEEDEEDEEEDLEDDDSSKDDEEDEDSSKDDESSQHNKSDESGNEDQDESEED